jgi:uncharacterized protein YaaQ
MTMQLLLAIVQDEDAGVLCKRLNDQGFRVTCINTVGGFLARGNVTILVGVEDDQVEDVLTAIRGTCRTRRSFINPTPLGTEPIHLALAAPAMPLEVQIGGATVFAFPVRRFVRFGGEAALATPAETPPAVASPEGANNLMDLVLAFVQNEDADPVTQALLQAGHRVTRINTAGAFLRRGNVTLLVGVERAEVDEVLQIVEANCQRRVEATSLETGMPMYSATVFVLEASRFVRV